MGSPLRASMYTTFVEAKEVVVVHLAGRADIESAEIFKKACRGFLLGRPVLLNFAQMAFVGSTGIVPFLQALAELTKDSTGDLRFCCVGSDYRRILDATSLRQRPMYESEQAGVSSFQYSDQIAIAQVAIAKTNVGGQMPVRTEATSEANTASPVTVGDGLEAADGPQPTVFGDLNLNPEPNLELDVADVPYSDDQADGDFSSVG